MSVSIYPFLFIVAAIVAAVGIKMLISTTSVGKHTYDDFIARRNSVSVICFSILIASISFFSRFLNNSSDYSARLALL